MKRFPTLLTLIACLLMNGISYAQEKTSILTWTVKVRDLKTSAERSFSGGADDLKHIRKIYKEKTAGLNEDDLYKVEMTFSNTNVFLIDSAVSLSKGKHIFDDHSILFTACEMYDFDGRGGSGPLWTEPFAGTKNTVSSDIDKKIVAEGHGSLFMEGNCVKSSDGRVCSLRKVVSNANLSMTGGGASGANTGGNVPTLKSDRNNTWFFLYLYGNEDPDAFFQLMVVAKDLKTGSTNYSNHKIPLNFKGWKTIAIRYADMNGDAQGQIPENITSVDYRLMSDKPEKKVRVNIDYLTVLFNK